MRIVNRVQPDNISIAGFIRLDMKMQNSVKVFLFQNSLNRSTTWYLALNYTSI